MANARRLIKRKRMPNCELYAELFGVGSTTALIRCTELGINPDSNNSSRQEVDKT
jgi:hypothetical protein